MESLYHVAVFGPYATNAENLGFFTSYERAVSEKAKLQEKIDAFELRDKEYWKGRIWSAKPSPEYGNPTVEIVKVMVEDIDTGKVHPDYVDAVAKYENRRPLASLPSSGKGCWFDFLREQKKVFDEGDDGVFRPMYVVTDFFLEKDYRKSQVVGVFRDPELAHDVQGKVLAMYSIGVECDTTMNGEHYVGLCAFTKSDEIDPEELYYARS